jgi:hypothetical protein
LKIKVQSALQISQLPEPILRDLCGSSSRSLRLRAFLLLIQKPLTAESAKNFRGEREEKQSLSLLKRALCQRPVMSEKVLPGKSPELTTTTLFH